MRTSGRNERFLFFFTIALDVGHVTIVRSLNNEIGGIVARIDEYAARA